MHLKNMVITTDLVLKFFGLIPAPVFHNLGKAKALKLIFWHLAIDQVEGCYIEFGVASGNSMRSAEISERRSHSVSLGIKSISRKLYGFDTFKNFSSDSEEDLHPSWEGENFSVGLNRVQKRFKRDHDRITFHALDASELNQELESSHKLNDYISEEAIAVVLFDMDLGSPTFHALEWVRPKLTDGSVVVFDEFLAYKGNPDLGESGAWIRFLQKYPEIRFRQLTTYGDGGIAFQLKISNL